jgi:non-specific protein-tyrosine kinase
MPAICNVVDSTVLEHYRRLRTKILQHQAAKPFRTLVVTSPAPEEGKTITVLNLGLSFAMLPGFKILLVDGDLRRGSLGACLGLEQRPGLSNFLDGSATLEDVVLKCEDVPIHFMGRGDSSLGASERLQSFDLKTKFDQLAEHFSLVLVDSPPVNLIADVEIVAAACDAVMLVARGFSTTMKSFQRAVHDLSSFRVIGTVLNGSTRSQSYYRHYRGYY